MLRKQLSFYVRSPGKEENTDTVVSRPSGFLSLEFNQINSLFITVEANQIYISSLNGPAIYLFIDLYSSNQASQGLGGFQLINDSRPSSDVGEL